MQNINDKLPLWNFQNAEGFYIIFKNKLQKYYTDSKNIEFIIDCIMYGDLLIEWYYNEKFESKTAKKKIAECRNNEKIIKQIHHLCRHVKHCRLKSNYPSIYLETEIEEPNFDAKYFNPAFFRTESRYCLITRENEKRYIDEMIPELELFYNKFFCNNRIQN